MRKLFLYTLVYIFFSNAKARITLQVLLYRYSYMNMMIPYWMLYKAHAYCFCHAQSYAIYKWEQCMVVAISWWHSPIIWNKTCYNYKKWSSWLQWSAVAAQIQTISPDILSFQVSQPYTHTHTTKPRPSTLQIVKIENICNYILPNKLSIFFFIKISFQFNTSPFALTSVTVTYTGMLFINIVKISQYLLFNPKIRPS